MNPVAHGYRIGLGPDLHRLEEGRPLWIGGVEIPAERGAVGHSDADVALHALTDALLGAIASGDIGELFPDTDPANAGSSSSIFVRRACEIVEEKGYQVVNVDLVVEVERPKLIPHRDTIRSRIGELLGLSPEQVGFKAKTGEKLPPIGTGEAIRAQAIALVVEKG